MKSNRNILLIICALAVLTAACSFTNPITNLFNGDEEITETAVPTPTAILAAPVQGGQENPNEPVIITGTIPFTSPFFLDGNAEPFVLLEDQAGFIDRN